MGKKPKEPHKFDGDKHFNVVARWNGWTYSEKGLQLATCLRGKAQNVLSSIPEALNGDYETVRSTLEKRFNPRIMKMRSLQFFGDKNGKHPSHSWIMGVM